MKKILHLVHSAEEWFVRIVISAMTLVTFAAAVNRFTIAYPMPWSEELVRILMAWLAFVGAAIGIRMGAHIGINVLTDHLPQKIQTWVARFVYLAGVLCCVILLYGGWQNVIAQAGQKTQALQISIGWRYACIPVGAVLMAIEFLSLLVLTFTRSTVADSDLRKGE